MKDVETLNTTVDEWRIEMERHDLIAVSGNTIREIAACTKMGLTATRERIRKLCKSDRCIVRNGSRVATDGHHYPVSVYQLTLKKEKK